MAANSRIRREAVRETASPPELPLRPFLHGMAQSIGVLHRPGQDERAGPSPEERDWWAAGDDLMHAMERTLPTGGIS